ncbi:MAG: CDGSH iron-sulfur domain-containing protein [Patescibacteria group bacterium]|nr:CDGSH iron-sulfur domain-containing protein [Patescibacteria group bacterium]MDZ4229187.1 CDGSH iron-sulfur domain-containing protein [Patescibacteria group bacterium]
MTKITAIKDGPYAVEGPLTIVDAGGQVKEVKAGENVGLCRCGASKTKPFCDGSHQAIGFKSDK